MADLRSRVRRALIGGVALAATVTALTAAPAGASGTVSGTVLRAGDSLPMPAGTTEVLACRQADFFGNGCFGTPVHLPVDGTGAFNGSLPDDTWQLQAALVGSSAGFSNPVQVVVSGGSVTQSLVIHAGVVTGSATRGGGATLPAGTLEVRACPSGSIFGYTCNVGGIGASAPVAADGSYSLALFNGSWNVAPFSPGVPGRQLATQVPVTIADAAVAQSLTVQAALVSGTLLHPSDSSPYPTGHAAVTLCTNAACTSGALTRAVVDATGAFQFAAPPGSWFVAPSAAPVVFTPTMFPNAILSGTAVSIGSLADGASAPPTALTLASARVHGTVTDLYTHGPISALVQICATPAVPPCSPNRGGANNPGDGTYAFLLPALASGTTAWNANARGTGLATSAPLSWSLADAADQLGDFAVGGGSVSGVVHDPAGNPVAGLINACNGTVCVFGGAAGSFFGQPTATDGTFTIPNVAPGAYELFALPPSSQTAPYGLGRHAGVAVGEGAPNTGNVVTLIDGGSLALTVTDANSAIIAGAQVSPCLENVPSMPGGRYCFSTPLSDAFGHATLAHLPGGAYSVLVSKSVPANAYGQAYAAGISVNPPATTSATVVLNPPNTVTGTVHDAASQPVQAQIVGCPGGQEPGAFLPTAVTGCRGMMPAGSTLPTGSFTRGQLGDSDWSFRAMATIGGTLYTSDARAVTLSGASTVALGDFVLGTVAPPDDGDGIVEPPAGKPASYDGNLDGVPDAQQANVTSIARGNGVLTLATPSTQFPLLDVTSASVPTTPVAPAGASFPAGLLGFAVVLPSGVTTVDVDVYLPLGTGANGYFKLQNGAWVDFSSHVTVVNGSHLVLHLVDNGTGDADGTTGLVVDPGAVAIRANVDTTAPTITITAPSEGASYVLGESVLAAYTCDDDPTGSGVGTCAGPVASGQAVGTTSVGTNTFTVQATDNAGNPSSKTVTFQVVWPFSGFTSPVDDPPTFNVTKAGSAIPVKFGLGGDRGFAILATGSPSSHRIDCSTSAPLDDIETTVSAGGSALTYDAQSGRYTYVWKTDKSWTGCRELVVALTDGSEHVARFRFK